MTVQLRVFASFGITLVFAFAGTAEGSRVDALSSSFAHSEAIGGTLGKCALGGAHAGTCGPAQYSVPVGTRIYCRELQPCTLSRTYTSRGS